MTLPSRTEAGGIVVLEEESTSRAGVVRCAGASHPGLARERNEDRLHIDAARGLLVVVDGMGGQAAGEVAAETALQSLLERLERHTGTAEQRVREAITLANHEVFRRGHENPEWAGMGCVLTLAVIENGVVTVGHVGDSRLYRLHAGRIDKLTHDHSPVGMREDEGELDELEAMRHPRRNEVYRSVGAEERAPHDREWIEVLRFPFEREDALLICSDGLSDLVPAGEIARVVRENASDERAVVQRLVDAANAAGGKDNVTVAFAAGERFAAEFVKPRPAPRPIAGGTTRATPARGGSWLDRRATFFALGALSGILIFAAFFLQDRSGGARRSAVLYPTPVHARHEVGPGREFRTIADALASSRPGDTVSVAAGRYREQVRLEEGVTLLGVPGQTILTPAADGSGAPAALVIEGLASGRVSGLSIEPAAPGTLDYGVIVRSSNVTIDDVDIRGARLAAIAIEGGGAPTVIACHLHNNPGAGVVVRGDAAPSIAGNRIVQNGHAPGELAPGIELEATARARIAGNIIAGNAAEGVRGAGPDTRSTVLESNVFTAFGESNGRGAVRGAGGSR